MGSWFTNGVFLEDSMLQFDENMRREYRQTRESFWESERLRYRRESILIASVCCFILAVFVGLTLLLGR